jgi:hypothetical protein
MFRMKTIAATALAGVLATAAFGAVDKIGKIDVTTDLSAIQNEEAATFWANLEADLENAIAARLTDRLVTADEQMDAKQENQATDDSGALKIEGTQIIVDIREVELANAFQRELNMGDAVLVGQVNITDDNDNSNFDAYELSVTLETAKIVVPEGTTLILSTDTTQAYTRLVEAFADGIVTRLK